MTNYLLSVLISITAIGLTQACVFLIFSGIGLLVRRTFGLREVTGHDWFAGFWMGLAAVIWFLFLWHFAFPIDWRAVVPVVAIGLAGLLQFRLDLIRAMSVLWRDHRGLLVTLAVIGLWVANLSMGSLTLRDDSVGYHLQSIRWAHQAAIMPGLANLHGPLGFTSGSTLYFAFMQAGPWGDFAHHVGASTLVMALLAQSLVALFRVTRNGAPAVSSLFDLWLLPAVFTLINGNITSVTTDLPVMVVMLAAFSGFYRYVTRTENGNADAAYNLVTVTTLLTLGLCFKFSTAIVVGLSWVLIVGLWIWTPGTPKKLRWRTVGWASIISAGLGVSWMARSVVLSGFPVFPNTFGAVPVPWQVPPEHALAELEFIVHSGRQTAYVLGTVPGLERFAVWFPRWLPRLVREDLFDVVVPVLVAAFASLLYLALVRKTPKGSGLSRGWLPLMPFGPGLVAWLLVAPEPRYVRYLFWVLAAVSCAQMLRVSLRRGTLNVLVVRGSCAVLCLAPVVINPIRSDPHLRPLTAVVTNNLNRVPIGPGTATAIPDGTVFVTQSGLQLFIPKGTVHRHCYNAPQPCTPNPSPRLRLLRPDDPSSGFTVDGEWNMIDWPYGFLPNLLPALRALRSE